MRSILEGGVRSLQHVTREPRLIAGFSGANVGRANHRLRSLADFSPWNETGWDAVCSVQEPIMGDSNYERPRRKAPVSQQHTRFVDYA